MERKTFRSILDKPFGARLNEMEEKGKSLFEILSNHKEGGGYEHDKEGQLILSTGYYLHSNGKYYPYSEREYYHLYSMDHALK